MTPETGRKGANPIRRWDLGKKRSLPHPLHFLRHLRLFAANPSSLPVAFSVAECHFNFLFKPFSPQIPLTNPIFMNRFSLIALSIYASIISNIP